MNSNLMNSQLRNFIVKPATLSILTGILIGTSYIPFPPWAIFFCFVPLWKVWLEQKSKFEIFKTGWIAQFVLTLIGFNWVAHTVHEFGHLPWPVAIAVLFLFCSLANLYLPLAGVFWFYFCQKINARPITKILLLPLFVAALERLMPQIFDWHFGYTWYWAHLPGMHLADIIGFTGLSTLGILANGLLLLAWWKATHSNSNSNSRSPSERWLPSWLTIALLNPALFIALNVSGYFHGQGAGQTDKIWRVLMVQANIGNQEKLAAEKGGAYRSSVISQFTEATRRGLQEQGPADFAIWPETAFPDLIDSPTLNNGYSLQLKNFILQSHTGLITGGYSRDTHGKYTNSFFIINANGEWAAPPYHKTMLLAFGEYMPFGEWFPDLYKWFPEVGDFGRGPGPSVMSVNGLRIGPQICYEGLFDWFTRSLANQKAQLIVNVTNDSWYDTVEEPFQHGFMTLSKAIEVRRPVVRSTNTGLSAVALANGDILPLSPLHQEWFHLYEIPYASASETTLFMTWGYWLIPGLMFLSLLVISLRSILSNDDKSRLGRNSKTPR